MTFIIAELGSNVVNTDNAIEAVGIAKQCGADAIKFQYFSFKDLYGMDYEDHFWAYPQLDFEKIKIKADACGIELMCTAFSPEGFKYVDKFVSRHKIASSDLSYLELLELACCSQKPVILSTGGSSLPDIKLATTALDDKKTTLLYCIATYPASNVDLKHIDALRMFGLPVGYSCHTTDYMTCVNAVRYHGATVIEKHFKLADLPTADNAHSILPEDFTKMVKLIHGKEWLEFPNRAEKEMQLKWKRRLIATRDIRAGDILTYGFNFGCYRSWTEDLEAMSGFLSYSMTGRVAQTEIRAFTPLCPKHIKN